MSVPTIYFPDVPFKLGFQRGRAHQTLITPGPSGRAQRRMMLSRPKRRMVCTLLGVDGSQYSVSTATFKTVRRFLSLLHGRYRPFYIFDPHYEDFDQEEPETFCGLFDTTFPMVTPFKNGIITNVYVDGVLTYGSGDFTQDDSGTGGEVRIASVSGGLPSDGTAITVDILHAKQRIPVVSLTDYDDFTYDWNAAEPPSEVNLQLEEDFG